MQIQLENTNFLLRLQNVTDKRDEDVVETAVGTGFEKKQIKANIDTVKRTLSPFIRKMQFPRELQIRFLRPAFRDKVLKAIQGKTLIKDGKNIRALKHIPWKIRQTRKPNHDTEEKR